MENNTKNTQNNNNLFRHYELYIAAIGGALSAITLDLFKNHNSAVIKNITYEIQSLFQSNSGYWVFLAFITIAMITISIVYISTPQGRKDAFILGWGVLSLFGVSVGTPKQTENSVEFDVSGTSQEEKLSDPRHNDNSNEYKKPASMGWLNLEKYFLWGSAYAQESKPKDLKKIWFFIDGPVKLSNQFDVKVTVFSEKFGKYIINTSVNPSFHIGLPSGKYKVSIYHPGFRSVTFPLVVGDKSMAFEFDMEAVAIDAIANLLGPEEKKIKASPEVSKIVDEAYIKCTEGKILEARKLSRDLDRFRRNRLDSESKRLLCL